MTNTFGQPNQQQRTSVPEVPVQEPKGSNSAEEQTFPFETEQSSHKPKCSPHQQGWPHHDLSGGHEHQNQQSGILQSFLAHQLEQPQTSTSISTPSQSTQGQILGAEGRETLIIDKQPLYIEYHSADTYLSHVGRSVTRLIPGAIHEKHVSSQDISNVHQVTVLAPNGPSYNHHSTTQTVSELPTSDFHSHPQNTCMPKPDYMSPGACNTVNRKFIEDSLLPKWVSTFIWSDVTVNKPLNNNHNNNNIDFLVLENLVLNMSDL